MTATSSVGVLISKLYDSDPDIRYMSLNDLVIAFHSINAEALRTDYNSSAKAMEGFLKTLNDPNGEVQNLTIKALSVFVLKCHPDVLHALLRQVASLPDVDNTSISAMAARAIVVSLPRPSPSAQRSQAVLQAYSAVSRVLIPALIGYTVFPAAGSKDLAAPAGVALLVNDLETGHDSNFIDVLTEIASCFGPLLQPEEVNALQKITLDIIESRRASSVMKKKAVTALSALSHFFSDELLSTVTSHLMNTFTTPHLTHTLRRLYINVLGAMAKAIPTKFGPHLKTLAPFVLSAVSQQELDEQMAEADEDDGQDPALDEVREAALIALEAFISSCPQPMQAYHLDTLKAILRFIKYDPNFIAFEADEADAMSDLAGDDDDFELDEDFEQEAGVEDEDDVSWKVRRCAARALNTFISVRSKQVFDSTDTYDQIAHALVDRFSEREESVRIEVLQALRFLIRRTADDDMPVVVAQSSSADPAMPVQSLKRKRQRRSSDVSMMDSVKQRRITGSMSPEVHTPPSGGAIESLTIIGPELVKGLLKLLKSSPLPSKQAALSVLQDFVVARRGGLSDHLTELVGVIVDLLSTSTADAHATLNIASSAGNASGTTLQIEALRVLGEVAKAHASSNVQPLVPQVLPVLASTTKSKSPKVAAEALKSIEQFVKLLTPPRSAAANKSSSSQMETLLSAVSDIIAAKSADTQVRSEAIHVLGVLLGRTSSPLGAKLLSTEAKTNAYELLYDASKNETTRYSAIKAIDVLAGLAPPKTTFSTEWYGKVCLELGSQLRKANRSLRGASLQALRVMLAEQHGSSNLDKASGQALVSMLIPMLTSKDLHMIGPTLLIFAAMVQDCSFVVVGQEFIGSLCELVVDAIAVNVVEQLAEVVQAIGSAGSGEPLMKALLRDVSLKGSPTVVGKLIGDLVVSGGDSVGINLDAFHQELQTSKDDKRKCLALSVLGEAGLRSGSSTSSSLAPELFIGYFDSNSADVTLAAAIALGRAAAGRGNGKVYVPAILALLNKAGTSQYLVLHTIKEILTYCEHTEELAPFQGALWDAAVAASRNEENRTIGADCIANLAIIQPKRYLQLLQALLSDNDASVRGAAILAFRDVFGGTDASFDKDLHPIMVEVLTAMLRDSDLENRRSALNTFNAATRNKAGLVMPHLGELVPLVIDQTLEDPSLIREVKMGPFVHRVDDGLDCRKSAYETIYTTVEIAPDAHLTPQLPALYDRIVAGLGDNHSIRALCSIMILKFSSTAPTETQRRLDDMADRFKAILAVALKETAVRHEHERVEEAKRSAIRTALELARTFPGGVIPLGGAAAANATTATSAPQARWVAFLDEMRTGHRKAVEDAEREMREKERA